MSKSERWIVGAFFAIALMAFFFPLASLQLPIVGPIDVSGYDVISKSQQINDRLGNMRNQVSEPSAEPSSTTGPRSGEQANLPLSIQALTFLPFEIIGSFGLSAISFFLCVGGASRGVARVSSTAAGMFGIGSILHIVVADSDIHAWFQAQIQASTNQANDNPFGALAQNISSLVVNAVHFRPGPGLYASAASASVGALLLHSGLLPKDPAPQAEAEQGDQLPQSDTGARLFAFVVIAVLLVGAAVFVLRYQGPDQTTSRSTGNVATHVPFVGCPADGQGGPVDPPQRKDKVVSMPAVLVQDVAYYSAGDSGVLAPRGWYCFETYGSGGTSLFIAPSQLDSSILFSDTWPGFTGPAIEYSVTSTDTSGRFAGAKTIARVFPAHMDFVKKVEAEGIDVDAPYLVGPFPNDTLKYLNNDAVEYMTPPNETGLGTLSRLKVNGSPITGIAILHLERGSLLQLSVRLPDDMAGLRPVIIQELERENLK